MLGILWLSHVVVISNLGWGGRKEVGAKNRLPSGRIGEQLWPTAIKINKNRIIKTNLMK